MKTTRKPTKHQGAPVPRTISAVYDNGRRGEPRNGCDCVQCFGYCIVSLDTRRYDEDPRPARQPED